jgi:uncharacterized protein YjdB
MTCGLGPQNWPPSGRLLLLLGPMSRFAALALSVSVLATVYVAACMLPGGPSDAARIQFTLESLGPYRVPLAGVFEPLIRISADGQVLTNPSYKLETLDPGVVRVDSTKRRLRGLMRGRADVRVTYLGATGTPDTVFSVQVVISRVAVDSALAFTELRDSTQLRAVALDANNAVVPDVPFTWSSADTMVAAVNDTGLVTAVDEGATTITAEADGVADSSAVRVTQVAAAVSIVPALDTLRTLNSLRQFIAFAFDSTGTRLTGAKARWSSSDPSVATVDAAGLARARRSGTARIVARVGQAEDTATLVVKQVLLILRVAPGLDTLSAINDTGRVSAIGFDSGGAKIPNLAVTWATNDSTIAIVDQTGLVRAQANGLVLVTASSGNQSAFATIVVKQEIVAVRVSPDSDALTGAGDTVRLRAVAVDRNGFVVDRAVFTWRSRDRFVATVDTAGVVTARGGGRTGVVALAPGGRADTVTVSVTGAPPLGAMLIRTTTTGSQPDPDGYAAVLDGSSTYHLGTSDSVAFTTIAGAHAVELTDYASNCILLGNPRTVDVPVSDTGRVKFVVSCESPGDSLIVTTTTTGADLDPNGYHVYVDEFCDWEGCSDPRWSASVGVNETVAFYPVPTGTHSIKLIDVDANCTVGQNPRSVTTSPGITTHVTFSVSCVQTGSVRVTTATTGANLDPDGYLVSLSGTNSQYSIGVNASFTFPRLLPGNYIVTLGSLAANCSISGPASKTVTVVGGVTTDVGFAVTCAPFAAIRVTATTTGVDPDPDGYFVTANNTGPSGSRSGAVAPNGAVVLDSLNQDTYSVTLSGVAGNCTVSGPGAVTVTLTWGVTADVAFAVTCTLPAAIRVTVATTGVDPDADGYVARALGPRGYSSIALAPNGAVVIDRLTAGTYTVTLDSVAVDCAVTTSNPVAITVAEGVTADVAFAVACTTASQLAVVRGVNGNTDIYLVNTTGAVLSRLTSDVAYDITPAWSPDGSKIAFVSMRDGNNEIYVMTADGSGQTRLTFNGASDRSPTWSPDGGRIAFVSNGDVYVMNANGSNPVRLSSSGNNNDPDWSPDGSKIAFSSSRDGTYAIYVMNADGSNPTRFSSGAQPDWSPDGAKLVFSRVVCDWDDCWTNLIVRSLNGFEIALPAAGNDPVWSRDGSWIAFGVGSTVSAIRPDGTRQVPILSNASEPAWKP